MDTQGFSNIQNTSLIQSDAGVIIHGGSFQVVHNNYTEGGNSLMGLDLLYKNVSHNAILNAGGRADEVRCHPGTREEALSEIKQWRDTRTTTIFWLSGPAGAGKSAIVETFAENYITSTFIMMNFFFFRADSTRNHLAPIVATFLFQLLKCYPAAKQYIAEVLSDMPYIFDQSIRDQFTHLIANPISRLREMHNDPRPIVLLIDGLDECGTEPKEARQAQATLVRILEDLVSIPGSCFIVLISSRPEAHLIRAFNEIESPYSSIFLDDKYRPSDDIRLFIIAEFSKIKKIHNLRHTIVDAQWPSPDTIEEIVRKSSGQFLYAAIVVRFIAASPASPAYSLDQIKGIRPAKRNFPFAELDAVYVHILAQADDWDAVTVCLSAQIIASSAGCSLICAIQPLEYTEHEVIAHTADLGSLMTFEKANLKFYHVSIVDFLTDPQRSAGFFLDIPAFCAHLATAHFTRKVHNNADDLHITLTIAVTATVSSAPLEDALARFPLRKFRFEFYNHGSSFLRMLDRLYGSEGNEVYYKALLRKWLPFFRQYTCVPHLLELDKVRFGLEIWENMRPRRFGVAGLMEHS